jgi:hypothetical protein
MQTKSLTTSVNPWDSCAFVPTYFGFRGRQVTQFVYGLTLRLSGFNFDPIAGVLSVQTPVGVVQCVLRYLPVDEIAPLCDAVSQAVDKGAEVRLARVPEADVRWFVGLQLANRVVDPVEVVSRDPRPWANWKPMK